MKSGQCASPKTTETSIVCKSTSEGLQLFFVNSLFDIFFNFICTQKHSGFHCRYLLTSILSHVFPHRLVTKAVNALVVAGHIKPSPCWRRSQPECIVGGTMRGYQLKSLEWLLALHEQGEMHTLTFSLSHIHKLQRNKIRRMISFLVLVSSRKY